MFCVFVIVFINVYVIILFIEWCMIVFIVVISNIKFKLILIKGIIINIFNNLCIGVVIVIVLI